MNSSLPTTHHPLRSRGFSLVEIIVGAALIAIVSISVYQAYSSVMRLSRGSGNKVTAILIANEQIEILHNLPYANVGEVGGIPSGLMAHLATVTRNNNTFTVNTTIRNVDDPFDNSFPADTSPADYKLASVVVTCTSCTESTVVSLTTTIAPKNLENVTTNGALYITVLNALGLPVPSATVDIVNTAQGLNFSDTTDVNGLLKIYDVPPASLAYSITATKDNYSTDKTYEPTTANPSPAKRALTVAASQITNTTFSIDTLADLSVTSTDGSCSSVGGYSFILQGNKTIGTNDGDPVYKYSTALTTSGAGTLAVNDLEWDAYSVVSDDTAYDLAGTLAVQPLNITPGQAATASLILKARNPSSLMVVVKDQATRLPISHASVTLKAGSDTMTQTTGVGSLMQSDWSGGATQINFIDPTKFYDSDGNIQISTSGELSLLKQGSVYSTSGWLISSTFDLKTAGSLYKITWVPLPQPAGTGNDSVKFQIASNNDNTTWGFVGPDGTASSYYTLTNNTIGSEHASKRYIRYKLFLNSESNAVTPIVNNVTFQFTTSCTPSAEVLFQGLAKTAVELTATAPGYSDYSQIDIVINKDWQEYDVYLSKQ